jgi:hypothetical protein
MKLRTGFVSNSSSSSFIVAFSVLPKTKEELQAMLFGDEKVYPNPYIFNANDTYGWTAEEVTATVWADLFSSTNSKRTGVISREEAIEVGISGYLEGAERPEMPSFNRNRSDKERAKDWDEYQEQWNRANGKVMEAFLARVPEGHILTHFEYCDNDGDYFQALEHGPLFRNLQSLRVSHH